jgi:hypothetical protein
MFTTTSPLLSTLDHRFTVDTHQHECRCGEWEDCAEHGWDDSACPRARGAIARGGPFYCVDCVDART